MGTTAEVAEQLGFDLPSVPALGRADFLVAPSNAVALRLIETWRDWPAGMLVLFGPAGAGKTHLAQVWASMAGARVLGLGELNTQDIPSLSIGPVVIENVPDLAGQAACENALFHLHNLMRAEGQPLLLTGHGRPSDWGIRLPDLASRIAAIPAAELEAPDDSLLAAVLAKQFADRQLTPPPEVITYLLRRMDRSFAAARDIVARLDAASIAQKRAITRSFVAGLLDKET